MKEIIKNEGFINISNFKDKFDLSRKYLITYLDYLDNYSDIKKVEDKRVFVQRFFLLKAENQIQISIKTR